MRKIEQEARRAWLNNRPFKKDNTEIEVSGVCTILKLHGNRIAERDTQSGKVIINDAHWKTATTKSRLNNVVGAHIYQRHHHWFLNGQPWDGSPIEVKV